MEKAMKLVGWLILFSTIPFLISQQGAGDHVIDVDKIMATATSGDADQPEATPDSKKPLAEESHCDHAIDVDPHLYCARESGSASSSINWESEAPASTLDPRVVELEREQKILGLYQTHELGRDVMALAIPVTSGIFAMHNPPGSTVVNLILVSIIIGFSAIWNGLLLRNTLPAGIANRLEQFGVSCLLAGGFGLIAVNLCPSLVWLPFLCWAFILFPFLLSHQSGSHSKYLVMSSIVYSL